MAFPPGVVIKDYQSDVSQGYPEPEARRPAGPFPDHHPDRRRFRSRRRVHVERFPAGRTGRYACST